MVVVVGWGSVGCGGETSSSSHSVVKTCMACLLGGCHSGCTYVVKLKGAAAVSEPAFASVHDRLIQPPARMYLPGHSGNNNTITNEGCTGAE